MKARERLKLFLHVASTAEDNRYAFDLPVSEGKAKDYIHRMRVELARLRRKLRDQGNQIRRFKMLLVSCDAIDAENTHVVLEFQDSAVNGLAKDLNDIFNVVASEDKIIDERAVRDLPPAPKTNGSLRINVKAS